MNKIRKQMPEEVEAFILVLRETYRLMAEYQLNRVEESEARLRLQLTRASKEMQKFKPLVQRRWWVYLEILENQQRFPLSDLISTLDSAVHQMHLRAGNRGMIREGAYICDLSPWSSEVKDFLEERRRVEASPFRKWSTRTAIRIRVVFHCFSLGLNHGY